MLRFAGVGVVVVLLGGCDEPPEQPVGQATALVTTPAAPGGEVGTRASGAGAPASGAAVTAPDPTPSVEPKLSPEPGTLRLVELFEAAPLKSEQAAIDKFVTMLKEKGLKEKGSSSVERASASEADVAYLANYLRAVETGDLPALPQAWGRFETVLVISVRAPRGAPGKHTSGGLNAKLLFSPPSSVPVYSSLYGARWGEPLDAGELARWIIEHTAAARTGAAPPTSPASAEPVKTVGAP